MMILRDWDLGLTVDHVLRGQGADPAVVRARRPGLVKTAEWALAEGLPLLEPVVMAGEFGVTAIRHERVLLEGKQALNSSLLARHIGGASRVVAMICTIGESLETIASEVLKSDPVMGLALDGLASAAVEELAVQACSYFGGKAEVERLKASIPLSPGMIGWPVDPGQRQLFGLVDGGQIGVRLNESLMMWPSKSISQVLGLGENLQAEGRTCDFCSLKETCRYQEHYEISG